ncbi:hypothetical protein PQG02_35685 (plasmid) [Nostoc sp. UHCC 0926]|uniref:hypothetical protein n=1 Tax=Nostoc sp. UHCC 0926 TaxID=3025190 RepID=UPI0023629DAF|nr:hypothetical protein [Nostoc sp. UHCC 0926]WDD36494.1 hypothetical protein PQG02_35685 [Nostoc sp. UHCC 0926]
MRNNYTPQEQKNIELVKEYMQIAYDPKRASADTVAHLCALTRISHKFGKEWGKNCYNLYMVSIPAIIRHDPTSRAIAPKTVQI